MWWVFQFTIAVETSASAAAWVLWQEREGCCGDHEGAGERVVQGVVQRHEDEHDRGPRKRDATFVGARRLNLTTSQ
jgi:hypothetical protein